MADELKALDQEVQTVLIQADVSRNEDVERMVGRVVEEFGAVHYAVNNAGVTSKQRVRSHELPIDMWDEVVAVNLRGVWLCQRAVIAQMLKQEANVTMR